MAGDWIKIEHVMPDKPEVYAIAERLELDPDAVAGKLLRVWIWADQQTIDGNAASVTEALLKRVTGVTGFVDAMIDVGWLEPYSTEGVGGFRFTNFDRHNGQSAKSRALTARRVASHKRKGNAKGNARSVTQALPREEKRREEYIHTQFEGQEEWNQSLLTQWGEYYTARTGRRLTDIEREQLAMRFTRRGQELSELDVSKSIEKGKEYLMECRSSGANGSNPNWMDDLKKEWADDES